MRSTGASGMFNSELIRLERAAMLPVMAEDNAPDRLHELMFHIIGRAGESVVAEAALISIGGGHHLFNAAAPLCHGSRRAAKSTLVVERTIVPGETHNSVGTVSLSRGIRFALSPKQRRR